MPGTPGIELRADGLDQVFPDPLRLSIGADRKRPKEPDAAPLGDEIGPDELAVDLRDETGDVLSREPAIDIVEIGQKFSGSGAARNVPKAVQRMRRAAGRSPSVNGRIMAFSSSSDNSRLGARGALAIRGAPPVATPRFARAAGLAALAASVKRPAKRCA